MYPSICPTGHLQMIDMTHLERKQVDKLHDVEGYVCSGCGEWVTVFTTTRSLDDAMHRLARLSVSRSDFRYHFMKTLKKATQVQKKAADYG